ncbi:MAG TPA: DEAD/DEAH box helicase family protein [Polyangia bacterium]|nr:DEAD/DEAH box helicase family protein [Polyangia bacterium]
MSEASSGPNTDPSDPGGNKMPFDISKLTASNPADTTLEPRKIFGALSDKKYSYLRDVQAEVLERWFARRMERDLVIKMNTGGGKTIVGLLLLKSCLNEGQFPAVYVAPDNYLVKQVQAEAGKLGIATTEDPRNGKCKEGKAILVTNIHTLFNGKSKFGVGDEGTKIPIGSILVDDAHSCLGTVERQFTLRLPSTHEAYRKLLLLFREALAQQSPTGILDVEAEDPQKLLLVPFWAWQDKQSEVLKVLHAHRQDNEFMFIWPLVHEALPLAQCVFGKGELEISLGCLPIDIVRSFAGAKRRIYMTATLADNSVLVSDFQADSNSIAKPITPSTADDLGDRLILAPQEINPNIDDAAIKQYAKSLATSFNVVVIVPSNSRAKFWEDVADLTLTADGLYEGVEKLKAGHVGIAVLVNKYDGIDLPKDACRVLIIDGIPEVSRLIDIVDASALEGSEFLLARAVQRIEQGMGRGVRSNDDHCVVLLLGARLVSRIHGPDAARLFSDATWRQIQLSRQASDQIAGQEIAQIDEVIQLCLKQDAEWRKASRGALVGVEYKQEEKVGPVTVAERGAFDFAQIRQYRKSADVLQEVINNVSDGRLRGWLKQQLAQYTHFFDPVAAQVLLLSALADNRLLLKAIEGVTYSRLSASAKSQAENLLDYVGRLYPTPNDYLIAINAVLDDLRFADNSFRRFESALNDLALHIGFGGQRPETEYNDGGPDVLWALGELRYLVIECKNEAVAEIISKDYSNQLSGAMNWFSSRYDVSCRATPIIVHPSATFSKQASPNVDTRVITGERLVALKHSVLKLAQGIGVQSGFKGAKEIAALLHQLNLTATTIAAAYTSPYSKEH